MVVCKELWPRIALKYANCSGKEQAKFVANVCLNKCGCVLKGMGAMFLFLRRKLARRSPRDCSFVRSKIKPRSANFLRVGVSVNVRDAFAVFPPVLRPPMTIWWISTIPSASLKWIRSKASQSPTRIPVIKRSRKVSCAQGFPAWRNHSSSVNCSSRSWGMRLVLFSPVFFCLTL